MTTDPTDLLAKADGQVIYLNREPGPKWDDEHVLDNGYSAVLIADLAAALRATTTRAEAHAETGRQGWLEVERLNTHVADLEAQLALYREFVEAHDAVEHLIADHTDDRDVYNAAVERANEARRTLGPYDKDPR